MSRISQIRLSDYHYDLPESRIAQTPLAKRDESRLLVYKKGQIFHQKFWELPSQLDPQKLLIFNNSKVIHARLEFFRETGARIEILLLKPVDPPTVEQAIQSKGTCTWKCIIGRKKKWKAGEILKREVDHVGNRFLLTAELVAPDQDHVKLSFDIHQLSFAAVLANLGSLPLPPYLKREANDLDEEQYQTVYAEKSGAVAAPTAGLHFSDRVLKELGQKGIQTEFLTLHVSAGTFLPVKSEYVIDHNMHSEEFFLELATLKNIRDRLPNIIAVGTTSMRVLESLYWAYFEVLKGKRSNMKSVHVPKDIAYIQTDELPSTEEALDTLIEHMETRNLKYFRGSTAILIMPGFKFRICSGLITNFHMPDTTLILLVAAFIGEDWKKVYQSALDNDYRFLSYGDSSLLLPV